MLASSRIGADEDINDYEGKTEEEINELIAAKVRVEDLVTLSLLFCGQIASWAISRDILQGVKKVDQSHQLVLGIRDILVRIRIRIPGSVPLTNGSESGSNSGSDSFLH
jgi:hypothetical protein